MVTRLAGNEEGKGEGGKGNGDGDEGGGWRRGNGDGGKSDGDGNNGGRKGMAMATKMVMVKATRVGEVGRQRNGYEGVHGGGVGGGRERWRAASSPPSNAATASINKSHLLLHSD